jgi:hypothetical protein
MRRCHSWTSATEHTAGQFLLSFGAKPAQELARGGTPRPT